MMGNSILSLAMVLLAACAPTPVVLDDCNAGAAGAMAVPLFHTCRLRNGGSVSLQDAVGGDYTCVLRPDGSPECWGVCWGPALSGPSDEPRTCALRSGDSVICWSPKDGGI